MDGLSASLVFLQNQDTGKNFLEFVAELINAQVDPAGSSGTFVKLSVVMLGFCETFLDANLSKGVEIDPNYVLDRLDFGGLTALHASSEQVSELKKKRQNEGSTTEYNYICECFFLTARVLNLGLLKAVSDFKHLVEDGILVQRALSFYRLMVVWLVEMVGAFKRILEFTCMPEHFVEDAMEFLIFASTIPKALDDVLLDDFMNFIIMFMDSPDYIRNPYLRAKMVQVLNCWMHRTSGSPATASLFEGNQLCLEYLVRNLLKLYVDIEFTGSHTQLYDEFNIRHNITELLVYLWTVPSHRSAWRRIAETEEKGIYLDFSNFLINDSVYLLDGSLSKILELEELEAEMPNTGEPAQKRARLLYSQENIVRIDMKLANDNISMLAYTSEHITAPFLLPEMVERVASMLNYFLRQLVGPQSKSITLKDPEKYEFRPKQLLKQIVCIYVHLARGDTENIFPAAISRGGWSCDNDQLFTAAADVLRRIDGDDLMILEEFIELGGKAKIAASEVLSDIPYEFFDPIQRSYDEEEETQRSIDDGDISGSSIATTSDLKDWFIEGIVRFLNSADIVELQNFKHVGAVRAAQLIAIREKKPFKNVNDLEEVGISGKKLKSMLGAVVDSDSR